MSRDPECAFCRIVAGEIPASVVFENESLTVFLDINPLAEGHLLIIPKEHVTQIKDMPPDLSGRMLACVPYLGKALLEVTGASGFNVLINNGREAGQVVPHVHAHLIPRKPLDDLGFRWPAGAYPAGRIQELATAYQAALASA